MASSVSRRLQSFSANRAAVPELQAVPLCDQLGGSECLGTMGPFYMIERCMDEPMTWRPTPLDWLHEELELVPGIGPRTAGQLRAEGRASLRQLADHPRFGSRACQAMSAIEGRDVLVLKNMGVSDADLLSLFEPGDIAFLDIETTSLYNSQPLFLVGMLFADECGLQLRQFFARRYDEEKALIGAVIDALAAFQAFVTYNGRSFDLPYLNSRAAYHRLEKRFSQVHLDLLHQTRRKYRGQLPNCRLVTVEENILGLPRGEDVPGEMVPRLYHEFVRTQDPEVIRGVLEHNAKDLVTLARMLPLLA